MNRVAVNLLWCVPGRVGGSEEYLTRQLAGLPTDSLDELAVELHVQPDFAAAHADLAARFATKQYRLGPDLRLSRIVAEHSALALRTRSAALVHHGGGTVPRFGGDRVVLTVHDLQYLRYPEYFSWARRRYLAATMPRSIRAATVITTPTEYVRSTVVEGFDVDPATVVVVPHGVDPEVAASSRTATEQLAVRQRLGLGDAPIVVYPAMTHPHKRHQVLIEMMERAAPDDETRLVLLGGAGTAEDDLRERIEVSRLGDRVIRTGRVPAHDRDMLIKMADALLFPSEYEGFGAPLIEAMALGTPVACSDQPALREVAGPAAVIVPIGADGHAWGAAVVEARRRRIDLVAAGYERLKHYSLAASGTALQAAYRQALS